MYSNYYNYPSSCSCYPSNYSMNYPTTTSMNYSTCNNPSDDRFIGGGLLAPFLLGGLAGAAVAPAFYPRPYPYQGFGFPGAPCCYPRFW